MKKLIKNKRKKRKTNNVSVNPTNVIPETYGNKKINSMSYKRKKQQINVN
jgi:hypothetical protein